MRKPIAAALATLALTLGMAISTPAPQASALQQWSPWINCRFQGGIGVNDYTPTSVQITWSGASGGPGVVTAVRFGNGNTEPIKHAEYTNWKNGVQQGNRVAWDFTPRTTYTSPFASNPYVTAGGRSASVRLVRQHGVYPPVDDECNFTVLY